MPTVEKGRELWFLGVFLAQYIGGLALIYWLGLRTGDLKLLDAGALATALIIMSTAHAVVIVEGIAMLAESFLKRRYEAGLQEGREEGLQEGLQEGREAGLQEGREEGVMQERKRSNANLRALAEKYGIPESELPFTDDDA